MPRDPLGPLVNAAFPARPDPLDVLLPPLPDRAAPEPPAPLASPEPAPPPAVRRRRSERAPRARSAPPPEPAPPPQAPKTAVMPAPLEAPRSRASIRAEIDADLLEEARCVAYWEAGVTLTGLVEEGLRLAVEQYKRERGGHPYPPRDGRIRTGRPLGPRP